MYSTLVLFSLIAASLSLDEPWRGPFADHVPGQIVQDTPEVAAAKRHHQAVHAKVLEILPPLPAEEQIFEDVQQRSHHGTPDYYQQTHHHFDAVPLQPSVKTVHHEDSRLAVEIPLSEFGEVPEVAAAREAHLLAYKQAKAILPPLKEEHTNVHYVPQPQARVVNTQYPLDTPEVVAARLEHARAFADAVSRQ